MNAPTVVVQGTLKPDGALELDKKPDLPPGRVQVTLQLIPHPDAPPDWWDTLEQIWKDQEARGYKGRTVEEMEAEEAAGRAEDDEYEERWRQIEARTGPASQGQS